jgi:hypothetical protein
MKAIYKEDLFDVPLLEFEDPYLQSVYEQLDSMKPGKWYPITKKEQEAAIKTLIDCRLARDISFSEDFGFVRRVKVK